jgi:predicted Zn-dependent protease
MPKALRHFSVLVSSLVLLGSCLGCSKNAAELERQRLSVAQSGLDHLFQLYPEVLNPGARGYLDELASRLQAGSGAGNYPIKIHLLESSKPFAYSPGAGQLPISTKLVESMHSESELVFALCHELSHQVLGHNDLILEEYDAASLDSRRADLELAADINALKLMLEAGYDPSTAPSALLRAYSAGGYFQEGAMENDPLYPALNSRLGRLADLIAKLPLHGYGTVDTREYRKFRDYVIRRSR